MALALWLNWLGVASFTPKGCGFDFLVGHMLRLQVQFPVGIHSKATD